MVPVTLDALREYSRTHDGRSNRYSAYWVRAYDEHVRVEPLEPCDEMHWVPCLDCDGSGRVSWIRTIARVPRWLWGMG